MSIAVAIPESIAVTQPVITVAVMEASSQAIVIRETQTAVVTAPPMIAVMDVGEKGEKGDPGEGAAPIEVVSHESIVAGQAIRVRATTGKGSPARANALSTADVIGFSTNSVGADATIEVSRDRVTVPDWTSIAGTEFLTPGETYYLSPTVAGGIQTTPPDSAGDVVCEVGEALSTTTLAVQIGIPVLL